MEPALAQSCLVGEKVLRDGIVTGPVAPGSPAGPGPALTSLGKVRDGQQQDRYSIWQITNSGTTDVRALLESVADGYRIPLLSRAGTSTLVRSDKAAGTAAHRLVIGGVQGASTTSEESAYSDETELSGSDCSFEGNPLYVAEQSGTLKLSTVHGAAVAEIPSVSAVEMLATYHENGDVWVLSDGVLRAHDAYGEPLRSVNAPGPGTAATGHQRLAIVGDGTVWLARGNTLYAINVFENVVVATVSYGEPIRELSVDPRRRRLWVLLATSARVVRLKTQPTTFISESFSIGLSSPGTVITYDPFWSETWIGTAGSLTRYDALGQPTAAATGLPIYATGHLTADGSGGLWGANGDTVFHLDANHVVDAQLQPFAGLPLSVADIAVNPADASIWVASNTRLRNYSLAGALLQDVVPTLADGVIRQFSSLDLYADRTPPYIRINSPAEESVVTFVRPPLEVSFDDPHGIGVAPDTIEFVVSGAALPATCVTSGNYGTCTLGADLPEGQVTLEPSIRDLAGNVSDPAPRTFTVDSAAPPVVTITSPPDQHVTNTSAVDLVGTLDRVAVLTIDGQTVAVSAELQFSHSVTLQEGLNTVLLVAVDSSERRTELSWRITLDTVAPAVPNVTAIQVIGAGSGVFTVAGGAGAVEGGTTVVITNLRTGASTTVVAAANGSFEAQIAAASGDELRVETRDLAGNAADATVTVDADSQAPAAPRLDLIDVQTDGQLVASVQGAAGAVEPNARVEIASFNTHSRVLAQASASGTFAATIQILGFDALLIRALDAAGNASETVTISVGQQPSLIVDGPAVGTAASGSVRVWGHAVAPPNSGVSIDGKRANVTAVAGGYTFEGSAVVSPGGNTITVLLHLPDGRTLSHALQLTGSAAWSPYLSADRTVGTAPMATRFTIEGAPGLQFDAVEYDFDSDTTVDLYESGTTSTTWEFQNPGTYAVTARLLQGTDTVATVTTTVTVRSPEQTAAAALQAWSGFSAALLAGNAQTAAARMTVTGGRKYMPAFTALANGLADIAAEFSMPEVTEIGNDYVEFAIMREVDGVQRAFLGYAVLGSDGAWRIESI